MKQEQIDALRHQPIPDQGLLIDGHWRAAASGQTLPVVSPIDGQILCQLAAAGAADVDLAVQAARRSYEQGVWSRMAPAERKKVLHRIADRIEAQADGSFVLLGRADRIVKIEEKRVSITAMEAALQAAGFVRGGGGPYFLELRTYRFRAHSMFDPELYRAKAEVEQWKQRCPIVTFTARAQLAGLIADDDFATDLLTPPPAAAEATDDDEEDLGTDPFDSDTDDDGLDDGDDQVVGGGRRLRGRQRARGRPLLASSL